MGSFFSRTQQEQVMGKPFLRFIASFPVAKPVLSSFGIYKRPVMRLQIRLLPLSAFLLLLTLISCKKEKAAPEADNSAALEKELPLMRLSKFQAGDKKIIQSSAEFSLLITAAEAALYPDLKNIDFTKSTLLLGSTSYTNLVSTLEYDWDKTGRQQYKLQFSYGGSATQPTGKFEFGLIVEKLPSAATVDFVLHPL